jgi:predicted RND superfamily exporter protein
VSEEYAVQEVVDMIKLYSSRNGGKIPENWECLRSVYAEVDEGYGRGTTGFEELKEEVSVEFDGMETATKALETHTTFEPESRAPFIRIKRSSIQNAELNPFEVHANDQIERLLKSISEGRQHIGPN